MNPHRRSRLAVAGVKEAPADPRGAPSERGRSAGVRLSASVVLCLALTGCDRSAAPDQAAPAGSARFEAARTPGGTGGVNSAETLEKPYVVVVSLDGFRHDYLQRYPTPSFDGGSDRSKACTSIRSWRGSSI